MVSIITPTHKKMIFWHITVLSVLCQECEDWEWIVLDNSEEPYFKKELDILLEQYPKYKKHKKKIKIYEKTFPEINIGKYKNFCVEKTTCKDNEFVLLLDHDDVLMPWIVKDIEKCRKKIGKSIDYITADCPIVSYWKNIICVEKIYENWLDPIQVEDFSIDNWNFKLNKILSTKRIDTLDLKNHLMYIAEHPRIIKKSVITNPLYKFSERVTYAEDTIQRIMLSWFLKGAYIPKQEIVCIHIRPDENDSNIIDSGTYKQFHENVNEINDLYKKIAELYNTYRWMFPDVEKIEIPHFNPDEE